MQTLQKYMLGVIFLAFGCALTGVICLVRSSIVIGLLLIALSMALTGIVYMLGQLRNALKRTSTK